MNKRFKLLDCTLRDGGYYNNWDFKKRLVNDYLNSINKTNIKYVELGFRTLNKKKIKGNTAYTTDSFINSLNIPKNLKIGVMINASDFLQSNLNNKKACEQLFPETKKTKIKFVRLACHIHEPFEIVNVINWLKKNNFIVSINLMQISEIRENQIKKICNLSTKLNIDVLYLADSLGSLKPKETCKMVNLFKKYWKGNLGIHAHNNMKLAFTNSVAANSNGAEWVDSTVLGMGRGPGNAKTEEIVKYFFKKKSNKINGKVLKNLINKHFLSLRQKYKWGANKYYYLAAKNKIHPTYIQEILFDKRYSKFSYLKIINNLKKIDTRKYNPFKLMRSMDFFIGNPKGLWSPLSLLQNKKVLIIGAGNSVSKYKKSLETFVQKYNVYVICLNTVRNFNNSLINLRAICHPLRILSDVFFHNHSIKNLVLPVSMIPKKIYKLYKIQNRKILDYGLSVKSNNSININKNYCILPKPLVVGYSLAIAISGKASHIFLAGFDGYKIDDPRNDETNQIFKILNKKYSKNFLISLTPTKYKLKYKTINSLKF
jgi:4-hydroxy 2-oxovalerate aldolase|tara:strand:- start:1506 stop:3131 length:1626 start_codon:yes stop_codon:yes gene_type:complete